ncbi:NAD-dependent epimerase/dehydratase family protein [Chitinophaga arvensicola]|uniref:Uncharacterized conserved protein YbjT, contains NAD(P)-binding and DUF2867 domains n=1 Tax=Chitinophaga arvensicola TaxID=29529 RepID=A0A1I0S7R7_9BACT|nr:NAD-dependent epimerase/dehydratase family protein [Chitinophaga arvensicola]SEW51763.1 Uncharacterized conserved protein YbjT, contains NAD(P)-binding and DUF2867 domains [Chitinophaga arvensicola]
MGIKVIITGATGLVGEGVLLECLSHPDVTAVLSVSRKPSGRQHPKLKECIVADFTQLDGVAAQFAGYDACFYCAGISSRGMKEADYHHITYDLTLHFAQQLLALNPELTFCFISGSHTDSTGKGKIMWARVKGQTELALMKLPFKKEYNFRPGFMKPSPGQQNIKGYYKVISWMFPFLRAVFPGQAITLKEVGQAMINSVLYGSDKQTLEVKDIASLAKVSS